MVDKGWTNVSLEDRLIDTIDRAVKAGIARNRAALVRAAVYEYLSRRKQSELDKFSGEDQSRG